jgi:hypothetical protein
MALLGAFPQAPFLVRKTHPIEGFSLDSFFPSLLPWQSFDFSLRPLLLNLGPYVFDKDFLSSGKKSRWTLARA